LNHGCSGCLWLSHLQDVPRLCFRDLLVVVGLDHLDAVLGHNLRS
jgi:hypothetical protein